MKIAVLIWELNISGGTQRQALELALSLRNKGHEVDVFCYVYDKEKCYRDICEQLDINFVEKALAVNRGFVKNKPNLFQGIRAFIFSHFYFLFIEDKIKFFLQKIERKHSLEYYDVVNLHDARVYKVMAIKPHKNYVWMINDLPISSSDKKNILIKILFFLRKQMFRFLYNGVRRILVLDSRMKNLVKTYLGMEAGVIRSGVNLDMYNNFGFVKNYSKDRYNIFACGVFFPHRRFEDIVDALEILKNKGINNLNLVINGGSERAREYFDFIKKRVDEKGLNEKIKIIAGVSEEDLKIHYIKSDIFVFPNNHQTWGLAVFEAMLAGCVCVVSKGAGAHEVLTDGYDAVLVDPESPMIIAEKLEWLINNPFKMKQISDNAMIFVKENLSWNKYADNMLYNFNYDKTNNIGCAR